MPAQLLDGKLMAAELEDELKKRVEALAQKGYTPGLTVILAVSYTHLDVYKRQGMYRDFEAHAREAACNLFRKEAE